MLKYNPSQRQFTCNSDDRTLISSTKTYSLEAEFENYLSASTTADKGFVDADIRFIDPCLSPFTFEPRTQDLIAPDAYTGNKFNFDFKKFNVNPVECLVLYSCVSVVRVDKQTNLSVPTCGEIDLDLQYDNGLTDGKIGFVARTTDYQSGKYPPGTVEVTVRGFAPLSSQTAFTTFRITLIDPCNAPQSLTKEAEWQS